MLLIWSLYHRCLCIYISIKKQGIVKFWHLPVYFCRTSITKTVTVWLILTAHAKGYLPSDFKWRFRNCELGRNLPFREILSATICNFSARKLCSFLWNHYKVQEEMDQKYRKYLERDTLVMVTKTIYNNIFLFLNLSFLIIISWTQG